MYLKDSGVKIANKQMIKKMNANGMRECLVSLSIITQINHHHIELKILKISS